MALVALMSCTLGAIGFWIVTTFWLAPPEAPIRKFQLLIEGQVPSNNASAISPDGRTVAYVADGRLWLRILDAVEPRMIPGSDGAVLPFWSPHSDTIGYFNAIDGTLNAATIRGDTSVVLCRLPTRGVYGGATWTPDNTIIFSQGPLGLFIVAKPDTTPGALLRPDQTQDDAGFYAPHMLPDGRTLVFSVWKKDGSWSLETTSGGIRARLMKAPPGEILTGPVYSPTGHLLYNRVGGGHQSIWTVPLSLEPATVTGPSAPVVPRGGWPSVSSDHTLVYTVTEGQEQEQLIWIDREGTPLGPAGQSHERIMTPAISPDNDYIAVSGFDRERWDIWVHDVLQGTKTRLTYNPEADSHPVWSSDGDRIAFVSERGDSSQILIQTPDGSQEIQPVFTGPLDDPAPAWSRDGYYMAYQAIDEESGARDLWYMPLKDRNPPVRFTETPHDEALPQFSPDGRYLAYQSDESGTWEVYVTRFPSGKDTRQVSFKGGIQPRWSYWSEELFYIRQDDNMMAVPVRTGRRFSMLETPIKLFKEEFLSSDPLQPAYDVTSDGQRFVVVREGVDTTISKIVVVENWNKAFGER